ncbi:MAG: DNA topoisomerase I [Candidatus Pacearchaeota archaeon]
MQKKRKVDKIFQDNGSGYVVPPILKPLAEEIEKINNSNKIDELSKKEVEREEEKQNEDIKKDYTLVICEKPQAAMRVAYALAEIIPVKRNLNGVPYWEVNRDDKKFIVVSAVGHLFILQERIKTNKWPVFDVEWKQNSGFVKKYIKVIEHFARNAKRFILACDYDVEGELIGFNALRFICKTQEAKRMKFSTLTKPDLVKSYEEIEPEINFGQAYAGETRHYLDWFYGINLSRALMEALKKAGSFQILSIGRVQGPALALIVSREEEILDFKPEKYWQVYLIIQGVKLKYNKDVKTKKDAEKFLRYKGKQVQVETKKEEQELKPLPPFDLTSLQIESYRLFRFSPAQTLAIAQNLYLHGLISYPRTSSQKLPPTIGLKRILEKLAKNFKNLMKVVKKEWPRQGSKTDPAHPAIYPTGEYGKISSDEKKVYELVVKRFLACFGENAVIENKRIVADKNFIATGKRILKKEWLEIYPYHMDLKELPDLQGKYKVDEVLFEEKETKPPIRYTPASIISELEKRELGTKATRAEILDRLYKRGYITGTQIRATPLGMAIAHSLARTSPLILDEKLTREFEEKMEKIRDEKIKDKIIKKQSEIFKDAKETLIKIAEEFKSKELEIGRMLLEGKKKADIKNFEANTLFSCPKCKKGKVVMKRSKKGKRFASCDNEKCDFSFPLPAQGMIKTSNETCECGVPKLILIKKGKPAWKFCSFCFTKTREKK